MIALIDGDILVYSVGFSVDRVEYEVDGYTFRYKKEAVEFVNASSVYTVADIKKNKVVEPLSYALNNMTTLLDKISKATECTDAMIFLSGDRNYRHDIFEHYKANRASARKPVYFAELRDFLINRYNATVSHNEEADDLIGKHQTTLTVICSLDKDLDMVEGLHYNWRQDRSYGISYTEARRNFYKQLLTGDATDNIGGIKGIGPVKASKLLQNAYTEKEMYTIVVEEWCKHVIKQLGCTPYTIEEVAKAVDEIILTTGRLLWVRRKQNEMWVPPVSLKSGLVADILSRLKAN